MRVTAVRLVEGRHPLQPSHDSLLPLQSGTQEHQHLVTESLGARGTEPHPTKHQLLLSVGGPCTGGPVSHCSGPALGKDPGERHLGISAVWGRKDGICQDSNQGLE